MRNVLTNSHCVEAAWITAAMALSVASAHAQNAAAGATKYQSTCSGCHGALPNATRPSVHKASANGAAIPTSSPHPSLTAAERADLAAYIPPGKPEIQIPSPPAAGDLTANSAKLYLGGGTTPVIASYTASCTGGGATKTATAQRNTSQYLTAVTVTGLSANTPYNCSGTATNSSGTSLPSASRVSITTAAASPGAPSSPNVVLAPPSVKISGFAKASNMGGGAVNCPVKLSDLGTNGFLVVKASADVPRMFQSKVVYSFSVQPPGATVGYPMMDGGGNAATNTHNNTRTLQVQKKGSYNFWVHAALWDGPKQVSQIGKSAVVTCQVQ